MMPSGDDVPTTIVCRFDETENAENEDDVMMDALDFSISLRLSLNDSCHLVDDMSGSIATGIKSDHVTDQELCAMKDMVASMRRNPELLNQSPVMQKACFTSSSHRRHTIERTSPGETDAVKNEDLCAMKDMIASMRKNPMLLYQSPIMQKACSTTNNTSAVSHGTPSLISPHETTPPTNTSSRRPLGTKFDPSTFPTLPLPSARGVSINKTAVKAPSSPTAVAAPASAMKLDTNNALLTKTRPRSI